MTVSIPATVPTTETEQVSDAVAVEALVTAAFGPGRFAKTAERLREGATPAAAFVVRQGGRLIGSVRLWPVTVGGVEGLFLGPIAVDAAARGSGVGGDLVAACVAFAKDAGVDGVLLVGDPPYFERFGFQPAPDAVLPGPVDRRRVMWLPVTVEAVAGPVRQV